MSRVQQAFGWSYGEEIKPFKPPLSDAEFHSYLNDQGQLTRPEELRLRIYHGGVEPSLRKVECMHLISVLLSTVSCHCYGMVINYQQGLFHQIVLLARLYNFSFCAM